MDGTERLYAPWGMDGDTPAPWLVEDTDSRVVVLDAQGGLIADCTNGFDSDEGWVMSSACGPLANLIAAAPDLLIACRQAIVALKGREHDGFLRDAIAKATGAAS